MATHDTIEEKALLADYLSRRLEWHRNNEVPFLQGLSSVTVLTYFFTGSEAEADTSFPHLECAIRETWRHCGLLHTVIVANSRFGCISRFANLYQNHVEIQIEPTLVPGSVESMSADCNGMLYKRFSTKYVLIIQNDGFPLRPIKDGSPGRSGKPSF